MVMGKSIMRTLLRWFRRRRTTLDCLIYSGPDLAAPPPPRHTHTRACAQIELFITHSPRPFQILSSTLNSAIPTAFKYFTPPTRKTHLRHTSRAALPSILNSVIQCYRRSVDGSFTTVSRAHSLTLLIKSMMEPFMFLGLGLVGSGSGSGNN
jgi:hypothetical protein